MRVRLREAAPEDLPAMAAIDNALVEDSERWYEVADLLAKGRCLLAEDLSGSSPIAIGYVAVAPRHFFEGWTVSGRLEGLDDGDAEIVYFRHNARGTPDTCG